MKPFLLLSTLFSACMALATPVTLSNVTDSRLNLLFSQLAQFRLAPQTPEEPAVTANSMNALLSAMAPEIKKLPGYTGVFTANCTVFFNHIIEQANCEISSSNSRALTAGSEFVPSERLSEEYQRQIGLSHILISTIFADWRQQPSQEFNNDLYFRIPTYTQTVSTSLSVSPSWIASTTKSLSMPGSESTSFSPPVTITPSMTSTGTSTHTHTETHTPSESLSRSLSLSLSQIISRTQSASSSMSPTASLSASHTGTHAGTQTRTPSESLSRSLSLSLSSSQSMSQTQTLTSGDTSTQSPSLSTSASWSSSRTPDVTPTAVVCRTPPNTGLMAAWSANTGVYADATNQTGRYTIFNGTVTDTFTNIQWEQAVSTSFMDWASAASYCGNRTTGGLSGWRVPNIVELQTLVDHTIDPALAVPINAGAFPSNTYNYVWSATANAGNLGNSWYVDFQSRGAPYMGLVGISYKVRCVRSCYPTPPASRYSVSGGQVTDGVSGLIWQQFSPTTGGSNNGLYQQAEANSYCTGLMLGNKTWRLPTARELLTLIDYSVNQNSLMMGAIFSGEPIAQYWSATQEVGISGGWYALFNNGQVAYVGTETIFRVRCVR